MFKGSNRCQLASNCIVNSFTKSSGTWHFWPGWTVPCQDHCPRFQAEVFGRGRCGLWGNWACSLSSFLLAWAVIAIASAEAQDGPREQANPTINKLIEDLGSADFQKREAASAALLAIGEPALVALASAEQGTDIEIRRRAEAIRESIEREKFSLLSQEFMRDANPAANHGLPGWTSFSKIAGSTRSAKRLFLEMLEEQRMVALCLESLEGGAVPDGVFDGLPADPQRRLWTVIGNVCKEVRFKLYTQGVRPVAGDVLALLITVGLLQDPPQDLHDAIRAEFVMGGFSGPMQQPGSRICFRKMLGRWVLRAPVTMADDIFHVVHLTQVPEGADMAHRVLAGAGAQETKAKALICLARFGGPPDLNQIEKLIEDKTVLFTFERPDGIREERIAPPFRVPGQPQPGSATSRRAYQRTLGDVALAAAMKIADLDVQAAFPIIRLSDQFGIMEDSIGFPVDAPETREAAQKIWRDYRSKSPKPTS